MERTIFDLLNELYYGKTPWDKLSDVDRKNFSPYMINRWISMSDYLDIVAIVQKNTLSMPPKCLYEFYREVLPKKKVYVKYVSGKKIEKHNRMLIDLICETYLISDIEAEEYVDIIRRIGKFDELINWVKKFGKDEKSIQQIQTTYK